MRWFKHFSSASKDPGLCKLMGEFGPWAYFSFFVILEEISRQMEPGSNDPVAVLTIRQWCELLRTKPKILRSFLERSRNIMGMLSECSDNVLVIRHPKLLKYRDEWTVRSGGTREALGTKSKNKSIEDLPIVPLSPDKILQEEVESVLVMWQSLPNLCRVLRREAHVEVLAKAVGEWGIAGVKQIIGRYSEIRSGRNGRYQTLPAWSPSELLSRREGNTARDLLADDWSERFKSIHAWRLEGEL